MQVQNINSNNYKNHYSPNFGTMYATKGGQQLLSKWWNNVPECMNKIEGWKKDLSNTERFSLQLDNLGLTLRMSIISKNSEWSGCEAPLRTYRNPKGRKLRVSGRDVVNCGDWVSYDLKFKTRKDALLAYNTLRKYSDMFWKSSLSHIDQIEWAVRSVEILEQGVRLPLKERLKSALQALKGGKQ